MKIDSKFGIYLDKNGLPNNHRIQENDEREYINFFNKKNEDNTFSIIMEGKEKKLTKEEVLKNIKEIYEEVLDIFYQFNIKKINQSEIPEKLNYTFPEQIPTLYSNSYCYLRKLELAMNDYLYENKNDLIEKVYYTRNINPEDNMKLLKEKLIELYVYQNIVLEDNNILDEKQNLKFLRSQSARNNVFNGIKNCLSELYDNYNNSEVFKIEEINNNFLDLEKNNLSIRKDRINYGVNANLLNSFYIDAERMDLKTDKLSGVYIFVKDSLGFVDTTKYDEIENHIPKPNEKIKSRYEEVTFVNFDHILNSRNKKLKYYGNKIEEISLRKDVEIFSENIEKLLSTIYSMNLKTLNASIKKEEPLIKEVIFIINDNLKKIGKDSLKISYKKLNIEDSLKQIIESHGKIIMSLNIFDIKESMKIKKTLRTLMTNVFLDIDYKNINQLNPKYFNIDTNENEEKYLEYKSLDRGYIYEFDKVKEIKLPEIPKEKRKPNGR